MRVELALVPFEPRLPDGMRVDGAWLGVWRLRAEESIEPPLLRCWLSGLPDGLDGGPEPGEGLDAVGWRGSELSWSIGTEDSEFLHGRASRGEWLPQEWGSCLPGNDAELAVGADWPNETSDTGLVTKLPRLPAGETAQIHHAVAWCSGGQAPDEVSTWFAVDVPFTDVLRQVTR